MLFPCYFNCHVCYVGNGAIIMCGIYMYVEAQVMEVVVLGISINYPPYKDICKKLGKALILVNFANSATQLELMCSHSFK